MAVAMTLLDRIPVGRAAVEGGIGPVNDSVTRGMTPESFDGQRGGGGGPLERHGVCIGLGWKVHRSENRIHSCPATNS